MQWSLVAALVPIVTILWRGASAQDCNYTSFLLNLGYSKECIDSGQSYMISCSNGEAPPYKECFPAPENITNILTEVKSLLQLIKTVEENSSSVVKSLLQEIKSAEENSSSVVKSLLQEMKSEIKAFRQEMKAEIKAIRQEMKSEKKAILQEMKPAEENSSSVLNTLLQEMKSERENSVSVIKAIRQEIKSGEENSSSVMKFLLQEMKSEMKAIRQEMMSAEENSSSVVKSLLQEMQSEIGNSVSEIKAILQEVKLELKNVTHNSQSRDCAIPGVTTVAAPEEKELPKNCAELKEQGETSSGVQTVYPYGSLNPKPTTVYCDQVTDGGGWTVIQSRSPLPIRENFQRNWTEYVEGFGDLKGEFWLGLDNIHALMNSAKMELRIDLEDAEGQSRWAHYATFHVGDAASKYVLRIGGYTGDAGDAMTSPSWNSNNMKFSTQDHDNDLYSGYNCAESFKGGWWYNHYSAVKLNGLPIVGKAPNNDGIIWQPFRGWTHSMKKATMRIRPVSLCF